MRVSTSLLVLCCLGATTMPLTQVLAVSTELQDQNTAMAEEINDRSKRQAAVHDEYEVFAQSACTNMAIKSGRTGWVYAVERQCSSSTVTCAVICNSPYLHVQDSQTVYRTWTALGAIHVYGGRPSSGPGTRSAPHIGLKVYIYGTADAGGCGPNYCCCHAR